MFLLPGCLQVDVSFTPASEFGKRGPRFELIFGDALEHPLVASPDEGELRGLAAHHLVRAWICLERGRVWQAEFWLSLARDHLLEAECVDRGLESAYGRGFDRLPDETLAPLRDALPRSLDATELRRALGVLVERFPASPAGARLRDLVGVDVL